MEVDEPGSDDHPGRVDAVRRDFRFGLTEDDAQPAVADPDRAREAIGAAPVDDGPVLDEELERLAQAGGAQLCSSTALPSGSVT